MRTGYLIKYFMKIIALYLMSYKYFIRQFFIELQKLYITLS